MTTSRTLPPALEPYLRLPPETSLILLTSTLGCTINWLTTRFIAGALYKDENTSSAGEPGQVSIVLVSWLRDSTFWKNEIRRCTGLDTTKLAQKNQFVFVDCFVNPQISLEDTEGKVTEEISKLSSSFGEGEGKILLLLDSPDVDLATASTTTLELNRFLLRLRSQVHATVLICSADQPLVSSATGESKPTPIEAETAAFVTTQAHSARLVLSVRELDTGAAKDISGVLRITKGGCYDEFESDEHDVNEAELLYLVQRDANAKVFSRGSDSS